MKYVAPYWLPGGNLQTIWAARGARRVHGQAVNFRRERWPTPDQDFIFVDWLKSAPMPGMERPLLVLFHGLEGSSQSHYAESFADFARQAQLDFVVPHFRGCGGEINLAPRAYHSGDHEEIDWVLGRLRGLHTGPILAVGVSLGGNALLRWAQEAGYTAAQKVSAVAAVSSPVDLAASGKAMGRGFNRLVYTRMFLHSMKPKALQKLNQFPGLFDRDALLASRNLYDFDNAFTAPLHGFKDTNDYWKRASAMPRLHEIKIPALLLNALNDPFVPPGSLPAAVPVGSAVTLWKPRHGGHVGFTGGSPPGHIRALPDAVGQWLLQNGANTHG